MLYSEVIHVLYYVLLKIIMLQNVNYLIVDYTIILVSIIRKFIPRLSDHVDRLKFYIITRKKKKEKNKNTKKKNRDYIYLCF